LHGYLVTIERDFRNNDSVPTVNFNEVSETFPKENPTIEVACFENDIPPSVVSTIDESQVPLSPLDDVTDDWSNNNNKKQQQQVVLSAPQRPIRQARASQTSGTVIPLPLASTWIWSNLW
jgi:hypothetical protein